MKKYNKCIICKMRKSLTSSKRCKKCFGKIHSLQMKDNKFAFKDGHTCRSYCCVDCKKSLYNFRSLRCYSCENKRKHKEGIINNKDKRNYFYKKGFLLTGKNNPNYKHGKPKCNTCHKELSNYRSKKCSDCNHKFYKGKYHGSWQGGLSAIGYSYKFNDNLKQSIRKRDHYICQLCSLPQSIYYRKLDVHHIDYNKQNCKEANLITLCGTCNRKANYNRDYWYAYFMYIMEYYYE